jgi:hypothetical protein
VIKFVNFRFALFTPPPLGDFHIHKHQVNPQYSSKRHLANKEMERSDEVGFDLGEH